MSSFNLFFLTGHSTTYRSIDGEYMVKQSSKGRVRIFNPDKIVMYVGVVEVEGKNPVC